MEEEAKAVQEVAKTTGKAIEAAERVAGFLSKVLGPAFSETAGIVYDWARYFRLKNLLRIQDKVEALYKMRRSEVEIMPIRPRYAIPLIQNASQEDDESIQDMWAGLIANATDPNKHSDPKKIYIDILSSLEPLDAKVLKLFSRRERFDNPPINMKTLIERTAADERELHLSLQNLARLGCMMARRPEKRLAYNSSTSFGDYVASPSATFIISPLGLRLIEACETECENE